jgi:hypothetical protein
VTVYVPEAFTPEEAEVLRRYFTNLDGPVFALVNLPEVVKGALFAATAVAQSLRRLFLDEPVGDLDVTGDAPIGHQMACRAEELYERVRGLRRRLGGPARRGAPGVRAGVEPADQGARVGSPDGVPRAVDPVHRVRHPARRPLPLLPRPRGVGVVTRHPLRRRPRSALRHVRISRRVDDRVVPRGAPEGPQRLRLRVPTSSPGQGVRLGSWGAAIGRDLERRDLRERPGVRDAAPAHARSPPSRSEGVRRAHARGAPKGHSLVPEAGRRRRPGRSLDAVPEAPGRRRRSGRSPLRPRGWRRPDGHTGRLGSRRRGQVAGGGRLRRHRPAQTQLLDRAKQLRHEDRVALLRAHVGDRVNWRHNRAGPSSASATGSTSSPTTAPSGTSSAIASSPSSGSGSARATATTSPRSSPTPG